MNSPAGAALGHADRAAIFPYLAGRPSGIWAALIAITTVLNSGIDAVQHFLTAGALLLFLTFHRRGDAWMLKAACFLCGLGQPREGMCRIGRTR